MKTEWILTVIASAGLIAAAGCGESDCDVDTTCTPDTIAADTITPVDTAGGDALQDTAVPDTVGDDTRDDVVEPPDVAGDDGDDAVNPVDVVDNDTAGDECVTDYDCDGCDSCIDEGGVMKCVDLTIYAGVKQCYSDDDCDDGQVCHYYPVGRPACGGGCSDDASYALHEWGVNVVTVDGTATMSAGPERFYGAIVAKPVIYIYSDDEFRLDMRVDYASGGSDETWPVVTNDDTVVWEGIQVGTAECIPTATPEPDMSGEVAPSLEIYDLPEWVVPDANCLTFGETISKVLFYSGPFDAYTPPVTASMNVYVEQGDASLTVTNTLAFGITGPVIALYRWTDSSCMDPSYCPVHTARLAWAVIDGLAAGETKNVDLEYSFLHVDATAENEYPSVNGILPDGWKALPATLQAALLTRGLTEAEAGVFMTAWNESMFGLLGQDADWYYPSYENGGFLMYLWPDARTQEMLPLTAVPAPATTARALVEYQQVPVTLPVRM